MMIHAGVGLISINILPYDRFFIIIAIVLQKKKKKVLQRIVVLLLALNRIGFFRFSSFFSVL